MSRPVVAIVGRPNVGKSTLFNRLIKQRKAIVDDRPGVTRDRVYGDCDWNDREFMLVDTGGFVPRTTELIASLVTQQVRLAIDQADLVVFVLDSQVGLQASDEEIASILKKSRKSVVVAANKADSEKNLPDTSEFYKLGLGEVYPASAANGRSIGDLLDAIVAKLPPSIIEKASEDFIKVAIVGRQNVGKSSLFNAIIGEDRQIVSDIPGTTRDSIDSLVEINGMKFNFIDTAGLRKKTRYPDIIDYYSSLRSLKAIERSDIALIVLDCVEGITAGDLRIAAQAFELRRGMLYIANKWDLIKGVEQAAFIKTVYNKAPNYRFASVIFTNALKRTGMDKVIAGILETDKQMNKRINTPELNSTFERIVGERHPPAKSGKLIKFYYITQTESKPPTFIIFCNYPKFIETSYTRYLENKLRENYGFAGAPILLIFKPRR